MSSNFKLAATTAVLLSTLSFTATAGDDKLFADITPLNWANELTWDFEALNRIDEDTPSERRFIVGVGALDPNDEYVDKFGNTFTIVDDVDEDCEDPVDDEGVLITSCELANPFIVKVFRGSSLILKEEITEAIWEDGFPECGGAELVLRTDNGDPVPVVQDGDKIVIQLQKAKPKKVGQGFFSEDEPLPGEAIEGCPEPEVEVEDEG
ncbi:hypothetical protein C9J01_12430 [Photobacterium rosenbergii]|uniref:Pullulanase n=1 Tax=Photobacterium rosenbergii TaxID=294936 RepID=A0A2T3NGE4_9GAMM|nr:hypothetical protein [Photobacterium rosenbergii]PSW13622.1 hypothetical protein C9J01_12430 [Photobacterium rosenbergii]